MRHTRSLLLLFLLSLAMTLGARERLPEPRAVETNAEERAIRSAYAKMTLYNKANYVQEMFGDQEWLADNVAMQFQLRDFRSGPVDEILDARWNELVTLPAGEIIRGDRITSRMNEQQYFSYRARWEPGYWSSLNDDRWTVREVFQIEPEAFLDYRRYTSFEVTVRFEGRSRTYRAIAFYRDGDGRPEILDNVVGLAGDVTVLGRETLPPAMAVADMPAKTRSRIASNNPVPEAWNAFDATDHRDGYHGTTFYFNPTCTAPLNGRHRCQILVSHAGGANCYGARTTLASHVGALSEAGDTQEGPQDSEVKCGAAAGIAFKRCTFSCSVTLSVTASGKGVGSVTATWQSYDSAAFWGAKYPHGLTCPAHAPEGDDEEDDVTDCQLEERDPTYATGGSGNTELVQVSTECGNNSPIVIDVDGDGFVLTSGAGGVFFDLNSNGVPDALSWTAAGDDDAFLVLDRNGNGTIDNGRELFGNFTPQLPGTSANGFRALAVYDRPVSGGNGDGVIDARDAIFASLRLWQDANHDGISDAGELRPLADAQIERLHLAYKTSKRVDEHGNAFRYRAKIDGKDSDAGRWAWDVFLVNP